ncbi:hypothetical protein HDU97_006175 [Phlyctochytrium planicorne]|nr:hypothetical protein HDU97_006175 [Phlyctochytrium planicorne]
MTAGLGSDVETNGTALTCAWPGCERTFTKKAHLKSHAVSHGNTKDTYECDVCGTAFRRRHDLNRHFRTRHLTLRPYHCIFCDASFSRTDALRKHLRFEARRGHVVPEPYEKYMNQSRAESAKSDSPVSEMAEHGNAGAAKESENAATKGPPFGVRFLIAGTEGVASH